MRNANNCAVYMLYRDGCLDARVSLVIDRYGCFIQYNNSRLSQ
jgi:hypothetical protein